MEHQEFIKYIEILKEKPFTLFPAPKGPDQKIRWNLKTFTYVDDSPTHVTIEDVETQKHYDVPLVLVEFANKGILRLTREVFPSNGSFI